MLERGGCRHPTEELAMTETTTAIATEETAVRDVYQRLMAAWNQGSGEAFAAVFADDGHLVGFDGHHFKGRDEIAPFQQELFDKWLKGSRLVGTVQDVRFLGPDVAVMHAVGGTIMRGKSTPAPGRDSVQTLVVTRQGHEWADRRAPEHPAATHRRWAGLPGLDGVRHGLEGAPAQQEGGIHLGGGSPRPQARPSTPTHENRAAGRREQR
jgi:uncharacterized protein (TIGR02246 family)